ncbi:MAG: hypothetical protein DWQ02_20845 [Bacteroidetes bacterium]|nr:MAG: hypothetical protein DWQ02_20845 [Bacteroidota bacterium]
MDCSIGEKDRTKEFIKLLDKTEKSNPVTKAYQAVAMAYKAKKAFNPIKKIDYLKSFNTLINEAVEESNKDPEVVFLRLTIQKNIPLGLGLSRAIESDTNYLNEQKTQIQESELGQDFKEFLIKFLEKNNAVTA